MCLASVQYPMTTLHLPHIRKPPPDLFSSHLRITFRHYPLISISNTISPSIPAYSTDRT